MSTAPDDIPTYLSTDTTLRAKILDACGMTCTFCHNEGTPVVVDNRKRQHVAFTAAGTSGRVSIYASRNGATFLPAPMRPDPSFAAALESLRVRMGFSELHLTGGEPTLHPQLPAIIARARDEGYEVCMTSNGENGAAQIADCANAGLNRINFSIFGTTPAELAQVQHARFRSPERAARKITALRRSIDTCLDHGVRANANIVVLDRTHVERVHRLLDTYAPELSVRLLNSLDHGQTSLDAISRILSERGAVAEAHYVTAGVSGARTSYRLADGRRIYVKWIRPVRLPRTCAGCRFNNDTDCQEGFYGLRLYRSQQHGYLVGVCLQRMDLCWPIEEFANSRIADEILSFRMAEHVNLVKTATGEQSAYHSN
ncbi:cyclic pyranopterin phosphate synthase [Murinocardiopsis flavida]|uniref:Cyclic pyranopterin phosphate synthase n=1 Tax=Murinocardiopsis flavida TaxID=645275 RepID=A0A2P8CBD4_9ACTN|nr:radical SAM protein [Murinocardiopsis flavida]PSK82255.1 cyclic pyranopterin phosphate synthase [Murinocardiopsis flavida]